MHHFTTTMMICALGLGLQSSHAATPPEKVPFRVVRFADLDLSHSQGVAVLYRRLKGAAETVCGPRDDRALKQSMRLKACVQSAMATAVAKVDQPALTAYYEAQSGGHKSTIQTARN